MQNIQFLIYFYNMNISSGTSELPFYFLNDSGLHVIFIYLYFKVVNFSFDSLQYCSDSLSIITVMYLLSINQQMLIQPLLGTVGA